MGIKQNYNSPRWTNEIVDCAMPMTFDTYSTCSFNCLYCFSFYQKSHSMNNYAGGKLVRSVNPEKVKELFEKSLCRKEEELSKTHQQFAPYIRDSMTMQWGGLADQFDMFEKGHGISLDLMKFFDQIDYPLSYSTKAVWWTKEDEYMDLVKKHAHNWHYKISIITLDGQKAKGVERLVPSPQERLEAIRRLSETGAHVTLRLRPYIVGMSDDYKKLIAAAKQAGADSVTTEFFCLELRADDRLKARYDEMSKVLGYDVYDFYRDKSKGSGYLRLNYKCKEPIIRKMRAVAHKLGMRFYVSDADHKAKSDFTNCCGAPPNFNYNKGQYAEALQIAKRRDSGKVFLSDIAPQLKRYTGDFEWARAAAYNTVNAQKRAKYAGSTMYDYIRDK